MEHEIKKEIDFESCVATENQSQSHTTNMSITEIKIKDKGEPQQKECMKIAKFNSTIHLYGGILFCTSGI